MSKIKCPTVSENVKITYVGKLIVDKRTVKQFHMKISFIKVMCKEKGVILAINFD